MKSLRRLQGCGIHPNVISVLHPDCLPAAGEFYAFYRDNNITDVSFSIDETQGANLNGSFDGQDRKPAIIAFLVELLDRAFADKYPLRIRDIERISSILTGSARMENEQLEAWQVVVVAANGDVTTFSPEFMELVSSRHNNFCFGNILTDDFHEIFKSELVSITQAEIRQGIEICRSSCDYFHVCGGGAPANKISENGVLASGETVFCRHSIQAAADALIEFLSGIGATQSAGQVPEWAVCEAASVAVDRVSP
jgi:uncharacterized protein